MVPARERQPGSTAEGAHHEFYRLLGLLVMGSITVLLCCGCTARLSPGDEQNFNHIALFDLNTHVSGEKVQFRAVLEWHRDQAGSYDWRLFDPKHPKCGGMVLSHMDPHMAPQVVEAYHKINPAQQSFWLVISGVCHHYSAAYGINPAQDPYAVISSCRIDGFYTSDRVRFPAYVPPAALK